MSNTETDDEILRKAVEKWGEEAQVRMLIEECGELIASASRLWRKRGKYEDFLEEIADVDIMIDEMKILFPHRIQGFREEKISRIANRLREE